MLCNIIKSWKKKKGKKKKRRWNGKILLIFNDGCISYYTVVGTMIRKKKGVFAILKIEDMSQKGLSSIVDRILQTAKKME